MPYMNREKLIYQEFLRRENNTRHHKYDEEMEMYDLMKVGDPRAVELATSMFNSALCGHLSDDILKNFKYLFIASITLVTRFAIEGGMDEETAYNTSDLYIQQVDSCQTVNHVLAVYEEMFSFFTQSMSAVKKKNLYTKPVLLCMDYIYYHLYEKITVSILAKQVDMNANYLSGLFKKETGQNISEYIIGQRMEAAKNMLLYSDSSCSDITSILNFNSQSYFTKVFHRTYGMTPVEYRKKFFRSNFEHSERFAHAPSRRLG